MKSIVITGGPGSGKTTLLEALKKQHFRCSDEISRQLIREQVALQTDCLPWKNLSAFADLALSRMIEAYTKASLAQEPTFFDRAIPDIIAYLKVGGLPVDEKYETAVKTYRYHSVVWMAPPWEAIYVHDNERWQTFQEAAELHRALVETYQSAGYTIAELPFSSVQDRVAYVLDPFKQVIPFQA